MCRARAGPGTHHIDREKCLRLFERLHEAGFMQGSPYPRNMLIQPGPLSVPDKERSLKEPSFRIIDFGRGHAVLPSDHARFRQVFREELWDAQRELGLHLD